MGGEVTKLVKGAYIPSAQRVPLLLRADPLVFFGLCHIVLWSASAYLFHQQGAGVFPADTRAHAAYALGEVEAPGSAYSLLHVVLNAMVTVAGWFGSGTGLESYVTAMTLLLVVSMVATSVLLVSYFNRYASHFPWLAGLAPLVLSIVSMFVVPGDTESLYIGIGTPNPWHNPTYIFARPFSIAVLFLVLGAYFDGLAKQHSVRRLVAIAAVAILSMWAKPSFLMSLLPAVAVFFLWKSASSTRLSLKYTVAVGLALLPALLPLMTIEAAVYGGASQEGGVILTWGSVWKLYSANIPLSILAGMAFPLYIVGVYRSGITPLMTVALMNFIIATLIYYFLAEKGFRFTHANFSWGYLSSMYFMFLAAIEMFLFRPAGGRIIRGFGWMLLAGHLGSGLYYFVKLLQGGSYL